MLDLLRAYNAESSEVPVRMQRIPWSTYYNKLLVAGLAGRGPEVFVLHMHAVPRFYNAGVIETVDDVFESGLTPALLTPKAMAGVTFAGHAFGLPLDVHPLGTYYNRALLDGVSVRPPADRPMSFDMFLDAARGATTSRSDATWGFAFAWLRTNAYAIVRQFGGDLVDASGSPAAMASPQAVEALTLCRSLIDEYRVAPSPAGFDSFVSFRQGRVAMLFEGSYMLPELLRQDRIDFGTAPVPALGPEPATWGDAHVLCLRRGLSAARRAQALRFMRYLSDRSAIWATAGQVPARIDVLRSGVLDELPPLRAFASQLDVVAFFPRVGWVFELLTSFDYAAERILRGRVSAGEALAEAAANAERARTRYNATREALA